MWQSNGFGNGASFQNNFNLNDFSSPPYGEPSTPLPGQHTFAQLPFGDGSDFQPEVGLYNQDAYFQNQYAAPQQHFSPPQFKMSPANNSNIRPAPQINARAAELKAQLLRSKEARGGSATPPVPAVGLVTRQTAPAEVQDSLRGSPQTPMTATVTQQLDDLISEHSGSKPTTQASVKHELPNDKSMASKRPQQNSTDMNGSAKSQELSLGSPNKVPKPGINGKSPVQAIGKENMSRHASHGSISEGEVVEDSPKKTTFPTVPKERQPASKIYTLSDEPARTLDHRPAKRPTSRGPRDGSPSRRPPPSNPRGYSQRSEDRHDEPQLQTDRRSYQPNHRPERKSTSDSDRDSRPRWSSRDESRHRPDSVNGHGREKINKPVKPSIPSLADVLPHDANLKDWLEITGYHNAQYRDRILYRRREIAKLDAAKQKLLAEEESEKGGLPANLGPQTPSSMLPPPIPNKAGSKTESAPPPREAVDDFKRDRVVSNKHGYNDVDDDYDRGSSRKIARTDDREHVSRSKEERSKEEENYDHRRPRSSDFGPSRRSSLDHRDERDSARHRYDDDRNSRGPRGSSRDRDVSPGRRAYESRPAARFGSEDGHDREEHLQRDERPFVNVGGYRGKAYDPNYRARGRGRGREPFQSHLHAEAKPEPTFGNKLANSKPYRDPKGFYRGGKGDSRYFIVKSFNEDNVSKCIADSVWTTQLQNGTIFKEAFETCRNVILVFSINKSRAFQGYARMESLPGTVEAPDWQRAINWESAGAFKVRWLAICSTRFHRIGHLKNALNENQAVLIGKDGQEIEENCGAGLIELIDEEAREALASWRHSDEHTKTTWEDYR
ncbi:Zinc finger CCCH domain-containing protein [Lachnellula suecica]|uniref:Zinc finger CCCH domain-containing protein n=1 Tax=Lachnellula suecica TaxID=602035 RepID=A0A8T9CMU7_9HELO|nr:Zinc finger CCCH domain-containing protein [Lachnellula suecica]